MDLSDAVGPIWTFAFRTWRALTVLVPGGRLESFGARADQIGSIVVVNLDRQPARWRRVKSELGRFQTSDGKPLASITRRLAAIDARDGRAVAATADVDPLYRIGDQLYVQPDTRLSDSFAADEPVRMTRQEVAVARSHIEVWKAIATGAESFVLVLEDDVWFKIGARSKIDQGWQAAIRRFATNGPDLTYLSYEDAGGTAERRDVGKKLFRPVRGLWFLSGYILSREAAGKLLRAMPVVGPVDLWMNYQFAGLDVLAMNSPVIAQRVDASSDNAYSVMPYLARAGVVDGKHGTKPPDINVAGELQLLAWTGGAGRESLAMALSMLGLRVRVFDGHEAALGHVQLAEILNTFDALVDPPLTPQTIAAALADERKFFLLESDAKTPVGLAADELPPRRSVVLAPGDTGDELWADICEMLAIVRPVHAFPAGAPREFQLFRDGRSTSPQGQLTLRRSESWPIDDSPWVLPPSYRWRPAQNPTRRPLTAIRPILEASMTEASVLFPSLTETFPGNLATFSPENLVYGEEGVRLVLDVAKDGQRPFRSGTFASTRSFKHGRFQAEIRAAAGPGLITGFFLHRGAPRQEIDIEFAGSDPRRMLTNVFFNPGDDGATIAYGYRGSPCWIDLGFDSTAEFHEYALDWRPDRVTWFVDGKVVHERVSWEPTPIPHLDMRVHANLWAPRSQELAGRVSERTLPASATFRNVLVAE